MISQPKIAWMPQTLMQISYEAPEYTDYRSLTDPYVKQVMIAGGGMRLSVKAYTNAGLLEHDKMFNPDACIYQMWSAMLNGFMYTYDIHQILTTGFKDDTLFRDPRGDDTWLYSF